MLLSKLKVTNDRNVKVYLLQYDASRDLINNLVESYPTYFTQTLFKPLLRCGIIHTSIVLKSTIDAVEVHFGCDGIVFNNPGKSGFGQPEQTFEFDNNLKLYDIADLLYRMEKEGFTAARYDFLDHNCNDFTKKFLQNTVKSGFPPHILNSTDKGIEAAGEILSNLTKEMHPLAKMSLDIGPVLLCLGLSKPPLWSRILSRISCQRNSLECPSKRNKVKQIKDSEIPFIGRPVRNSVVGIMNFEEDYSDSECVIA